MFTNKRLNSNPPAWAAKPLALLQQPSPVMAVLQRPSCQLSLAVAVMLCLLNSARGYAYGR